MQTNIKSEHLTRLRELIGPIADPSVRLAIEFAALEFGSERYAAGIVDAREPRPQDYLAAVASLLCARDEPGLTLVQSHD